MDSNNQSPAVDPVDLLSEHYEAPEIRDSFRDDLLAESSRIVAGRRRAPVRRWAMSLAGAAAVAVLILLGGHLLRSTPGHPAMLRHGLSAAAKPTPAPQQKPDRSIPPAPAPKEPPSSTDNLAEPPRHRRPMAPSPPRAPKPNGPPIVAVIYAQQPVTDGSGRALAAGDRLPSGAAIQTGRQGRVTLVTPKGSELHLDSNTRLVLSNRSVAAISRGRLYCSNRDREIARIDTPAGRVKLLGTVVDTAVVRKDTVAVTVVEGRVELTNRHGAALVDAGRRSVLVAFRPPQAGARVNTFKETSWYHGRGEVQSDFGDIAFRVARGGLLLSEVWTMKTDGAGRHRVRTFIGYSYEPDLWLPGQRWLSVSLSSLLWTTPDIKARNASAGAGHPIVPEGSFLLDAATGQVAPLALPEGYDPVYKAIAPNGVLMAFCGRRWHDPNDLSKGGEGGVWVFDRQTGKVARVLSGAVKTAPAWSPDSRHIAISSGQGYTSNHNLVIIDVVTGQVRDLGINGAGACYSPDGAKIAYCGQFRRNNAWYRGVPDSGSVFILDLTRGAKPVRISPAGVDAIEPRWSPDGTRVLYHTGDGRVYVAPADGGSPREIYHQAEDERMFTASWAPSGSEVYLTFMPNREGKSHTRLVAADGSGSRTVVDESSDGKLPPTAQAQTDAACTAIREAVFQYAMGKMHSFEADLPARRQCFATAADIFSGLVWDYPLSGIGPDDALRYADAAAKEARRSDADVLRDSCAERMRYLGSAIISAAAEHHQFPPDLPTALKWSQDAGWRYNWLSSTDEERVVMLATCPGTVLNGPVPYLYNVPAAGHEPQIGDVIVSCPLHPDNRVEWDEYDVRGLNTPLMTNGKPGAWCHIDRHLGIPYRFENVGDEPLTIVRHLLSDTYEIRGEAKLLPTGRVYSNETAKLGPLDEGSVARAIDAAGTVDWGGLSGMDLADAKNELEFCRCVAGYEAGLPVADCEFLNRGNLFRAIDGEPAKLMYCGQPGGSCGAEGTDLRFELIGPGRIELYQLSPSGRFRVYGTVRVVQTRQVCKNGFIGKDGKVLSTE